MAKRMPPHSIPPGEERDPRHRMRVMRKRLASDVEHLRADIDKVDEPQLRAMFETSAEVLSGLVKAFSDYEKRNEEAWQRPY